MLCTWIEKWLLLDHYDHIFQHYVLIYCVLEEQVQLFSGKVYHGSSFWSATNCDFVAFSILILTLSKRKRKKIVQIFTPF